MKNIKDELDKRKEGAVAERLNIVKGVALMESDVRGLQNQIDAGKDKIIELSGVITALEGLIKLYVEQKAPSG